jgi:hypothetical protein
MTLTSGDGSNASFTGSMMASQAWLINRQPF